MNTPYRKKLLNHTAAVAMAVATLAGCAPERLVHRNAAVQLPARFAQQTDTASIGDLSPRQLFTDPYLQQLIDTALHRNWDLQTALQRVEQARANLISTKGALKPTVDAVASAGVTRYGDYTLDGVGNYDTNLSGNIDKDQKIPTPFTPDYFLGLRSSWEIDVWGKLKNRKSAAYHRMLASEAGVRLVTTVLIAEVAGRYYELLALDSEQAVLQKNRELQQAAVEVVQAQKEGGRATELAVQQFHAQLLRTQALEAFLRQRITETENELNLLLGRVPQPIKRRSAVLLDSLPANAATGLPSAFLLRRPDIQQAELELKAADADVAAARAAFLPSFTLTPAIGLNTFSAATLFHPGSIAFGALGSLAAPLFNRDALKGQYYGAAAEKQQAWYAYQKAVVQGYHEVVTTLSRMQNLRQQFLLKEKEVETLKNAVATAKDLYLAGYATYLEVITTQRNVLESELELIDLRKQLFLSQVHLYRSLGGGWQ